MYAKTANELRRLILDNPDQMPSTFLLDSSFAAWCYDRKTTRWLKSAFNRDADPDDCQRWNISRSEWKENIEMALLAKRKAEGQKI